MKNVLTVVGLIALIVLVVVAGPLLLIWALNTLFPVLAIPYTGWTWLAALILAATISPTVKVKR
jgi:hypothetical protein